MMRLRYLLLLPLLLLAGCSFVLLAFVRNLGTEPVTLHLYTRSPTIHAGRSLPMAPRLIRPSAHALRQLTNSVAVEVRPGELIVTLPPHATVWLGRFEPWAALVDSLRIVRAGAADGFTLDSLALSQRWQTRIRPVGGARSWLDIP